MSAVSATSSAVSSAITSSTGSSELDKDAFMLLLVTQFQYQDPLNPMEDKEFIAQLAQFSSLEQMMLLNEGMDGLTAATNNQEMINATSYIGKAVDVSGSTISKQTDATTGKTSVSKMYYAIGEQSVKGQINIFDENMNLVSSIALPAQAAGTHEFQWDGTAYGEGEAADGVYQIIPTFYNADGDTILDYDMVVDGIVSGVTTSEGVTYLSLSDGRVTPLSEVRRVSTPTVVSTTTPDTDTDDTTSGSTSTEDDDSASGSSANTSGDTSGTDASGANSAASSTGTDSATSGTNTESATADASGAASGTNGDTTGATDSTTTP